MNYFMSCFTSVVMGILVLITWVCASSPEIKENSIQSHVLVEPEKNERAYLTRRLVAFPATEERIEKMADILNQQDQGDVLNGKYYENGMQKDGQWVQKKKDLIMGNLRQGLISTRFFYLRENPKELVCFVGAELSYFSDSPDTVNALVPFWGTVISHQGKSLTSEALRGFVRGDILRDPVFSSVLISVHPENMGSIHLAEGVLGAIKVGDGWNYTKTQPRAFYEVTAQNVREKSKLFECVSWIGC